MVVSLFGFSSFIVRFLLLILLILHIKNPSISIFISISIPTAEAAGDVDSLLLLKSWSQDSWGVLSTWSISSASRFCSWGGVSCTRDNRNVATISLSGKRLKFTLRNGLGSLRRLTYLNLSSNIIDGEIPNDFSQLHSLEVLDLSNNRLRGGIPRGLGSLPNLQVFIISGNSIGGFFPNNLCNAPRLRTIISNNNQLIGPITDDLWNCSMLVTLNVARNRIDSKFPQRLNRLKSLHSINVAHNMIRGQIPSELADIVELSNVQLQYNSLYGSIPSVFGRCRVLTTFDVSSNRLTGYIPSTFGDLILLEDFRVANNALQGKIPSELGKLTSLKHRLDLSGNRFFGEIPATLGNLNAIGIIDLSGNLLSGQLPESIGSCSSLRKISIAGNGITGNIPAGWFALPMLYSLNLSRNKLSGSIASDLSYMVALSSMDLSHNFLSGEIPGSLTKLIELRYLDLSANNLEGVVPNFSRHIRVSVTGNKNLCGWAIRITCPSPKLEEPPTKSQYSKILKLAGENLGIGLAVLVFLVVGFPVTSMIYFYLFRREKYKAMTDAIRSRLGRLFCFSSKSCCCHMGSCCNRPKYTVELVRTATNNFNNNNIIGIGQKYAVYSALWPEKTANKEKNMVVKRLHQNYQSQIAFFLQQTKTLSSVQHSNVVRILDWCSDSNELCILLSTSMNGSLDYYLYNSDMAFYLGWEQCLKIALSIANGFVYLHAKWQRKKIVHCNLQPSNVLLDENFEAQISGLRYCLRSNLKNFLFEETEACYTSPECLNGEPLSKASEVYSFGVFVLALLTRYMPENCFSTLGMPLEKWVREVYPVQVVDYVVLQTAPTEGHVRSIVELALSCTLEDHTLRPTILQVKKKLEELL